MYLVYKTTNLLNKRFYFGVHKTDDREDGYLGSGHLILKAIQKYGSLNFKREILAEFDTREAAFDLEVDLIASAEGDPRCYNISKGGDGNWDIVNARSDQSWRSKKRKPGSGENISRAKMGKSIPKLSLALRGKPKSEVAKQHMSGAAKLRATTEEGISQLRKNGFTSLLQGTLKPGRPSVSAIDKIRKSRLGTTASLLTKSRMVIAQKARQARERELRVLSR